MHRKPHTRILLAVVLAALASGAGCDKLRARDKLNKGVQAFKNAQFDQAVEDFKQAKDLDPNLMNARLYLATAYANQYIPGAPSDDNIRMGQQAITEFQQVLEKEPSNLSAIDGIGSIIYNMGGTPFDAKKLEESKTYHEKHIALKPEDPEPYYWIGVIDWSLAYRGNKDAREDYNKTAKKQIKDTDPMPPALATQFQQKYGPIVDEGLKNLQMAMDRRPDYDDAMAYLNLLYRQKADMEMTPDARDNDVKLADDLVDKVKAIKQRKMTAPPAS
ncbi:MAG: tetratricopeptide repeat protein [Candidatus Acidiferrales bacterium]